MMKNTMPPARESLTKNGGKSRCPLPAARLLYISRRPVLLLLERTQKRLDPYYSVVKVGPVDANQKK